MDEKITLEYAVYGSLINGSGEGDNIVSSSGIYPNNKIENCIIKIDDELQDNALKYRNQSKQNLSNLFYLLNISLNNRKPSTIVIKVIPEFTFFPNLKRYISRREYYIVTKGQVENFNQLIKSIPESIQYKREKHDDLPLEINQEKKNISADKELLYILLKALLERKTLVVLIRQNSNESSEPVLELLNFLPEIYKNHIQFGLDLKANDKFASDYLHLYTSIDRGENLDDLKNQTQSDSILNAFVTAFASDNFWFNDDLEISNTTNFSSKNNLYELFSCHYTYTFCQLFLSEQIKNIEDYVHIFDQIKTNIKTYIERPELFDRIILLYKALVKSKFTDEEIFGLFWNKYFSLDKIFIKKIDPLLDENLDLYVSNLWKKAKSFKEIILISNNLFRDAQDSSIDLMREQVKFEYLNKTTELKIEEFTPIVSFYNQYKTEFVKELSFNNLLSKFKIDTNYKNLDDAIFKSLFTHEIINELPLEVTMSILQHVGLKKFLSFNNESDYRLIKNSAVKQFVQSEIFKPNVVNELINEKNNWIFSTLKPHEKQEVSNRFYAYILNTNVSNREFQALLKAENIILSEEQIKDFILPFFEKERKTPAQSDFIKEILLTAHKKQVQLNISSAFLPKKDIELLDILTIIYSFSSLFNKENLTQFSKEQLSRIWNSNVLDVENKIDLSNTIIANDDSKEYLYSSLMQDITTYFKKLDFQSLHKSFLIIAEKKLNDKDFWNAFLKSDTATFLKTSYSSAPFNRSVILELTEVYKKNFEYAVNDYYLPFFIYELNDMLYKKHLKSRGIIPFKVMKTISLVNKSLRNLIYILTVICVALAIWIYVLSAKLNNNTIQVNTQNKKLDSLKKEIQIVKTKSDSLTKNIKIDSTNTTKPNMQGKH